MRNCLYEFGDAFQNSIVLILNLGVLIAPKAYLELLSRGIIKFEGGRGAKMF